VADPADGHFTTHDQLFEFGTNELEGLKIFLAPGGRRNEPRDRFAQPRFDGRAGRTGNCAACHTPPAFTDFIFHNTGSTQEEYDAIHGPGSFQYVFVPGLATRQSNYDAYLPPTPNHPNATGKFETPPAPNQPGAVDIGLWNVFANPDFPAPQPALRQILPELLGVPTPQIENPTMRNGQFAFFGEGPPGHTCYVMASASPQTPPAQWLVVATNDFDPRGRLGFAARADDGTPARFYRLSLSMPSTAAALPLTIALFKTPTLRDLGHSDPYLHTGRMNTLEDVVEFYRNFSNLARLGVVRNADPQLGGISLDDSSVAPVAAFLSSLNEDYTD